MSILEITIIEEDEEEDPNSNYLINTEVEKDKVRQIIKYQKSLYSSSSSTSSSFRNINTRKGSSLMELMKEGSSSLGRLFEMEHTTLATLFKDYSGSSFIKPILLWGSSDSDHSGPHDYDPWNFNHWIYNRSHISSRWSVGSCDHSRVDFDKSNLLMTSFDNKDSSFESNFRQPPPRLRRKRSFQRLPRLRVWNWRKFGFRFKVRKLSVFICCRKF